MTTWHLAMRWLGLRDRAERRRRRGPRTPLFWSIMALACLAMVACWVFLALGPRWWPGYVCAGVTIVLSLVAEAYRDRDFLRERG
jgi:Flp pilus assembly protein TadB